MGRKIDSSGRQRSATFRFYEELNDFLPPDRRRVAFDFGFKGTPSVKDTVEAIGVPHTEVDVILVDGESVGFDFLLRGGERVAVYPVFERLDVAALTRLRPKPLREPRFILDVHLGRLARYLRLLGFDATYDATRDDAAIVTIATTQRRIILTRDKGLLKRKAVTHGYWLRNTNPRRQLVEVVDALDLSGLVRAFSRCMVCNAGLETVDEEDVSDLLPAGVRGRFDHLACCPGCGRVYWPGSHYDRMLELLGSLLRD